MAHKVTSLYLGRLKYEAGLKAQEDALAGLSSEGAGMVLGLEHEPVVTLGKRGRIEDDLRVTEAELKSRGYQLYQSARGGQATLHSPGQLVIYPCLDLVRLNLGARSYVELLETATQSFLAEFGIESRVGEDEPGIYTDRGKIAFFGLRISRGKSSHGIAVNVANALEDFALIRSCGKAEETFDCLGSYGVSAPLEALFLTWVGHFLRRLT